MKNNHVADANHPGKTALMQWLSETAPVVLPKAPSINRLLMTPVLATTLIACAALLACGTEDTAPEPAEERPAAQTTDSTDSRPPGSGTPNVAADIPTPANNRQPANDGDAGSSGSSTPRPASRTERTTVPTTPAASVQNGQTTASAPSDEQLKQAEDLYLEAELHLLNQRFHRAAHNLDRAIAINPNLAEAYTLRGFARTVLRDHDGAMQDFETALGMEAENAGRAYAFRSYAHSEMGNYDEALLDAEKALETVDRDNQFAWADAGLAKFTAQYRSGEYQAIDRHTSRNRPSGSTGELNEKLGPYGLVKLYENADLNRTIETILAAETNLLLNPDDANSYRDRYNAYRNLRWDAMALQDLGKIIELSGEDRRASLYLQRARIWTQIGDYEAIVQNAGDLDPRRDIEAAVLLAIAHWNLGDVQKATDTINALDFGNPKVLFNWQEDHPPTRADYLSPSDPHVTAPYLAVRGALLAVQGQLEEGLKYLELPTCNDRIIAAAADDAPIAWHSRYGDTQALHDVASQLANTWFNAKRYESPWTEMGQAKAMWVWCDYPNDFIADPEAGVWTTMALPSYGTQPNPPFPTRVLYSAHVSHPNYFDAIVIASDDPDLHHYMAAWAQLGLSYSTAIDVLRDIDRAIELGSDNPDAHRIQAETHLAWAWGRNPIYRPDNEAGQTWMEHHYSQAVDSYSTYESMASPARWEAARYHFARGQILGRMKQKEEAQSAYQQAFQHGFSEEAVKQALMELNR